MYRLRHHSSNRLKVFFITMAILVAIVVGAAYFGNKYYIEQLEPVSQSDVTQVIAIEAGEGANGVAERLEQEGLVRAAWAFSWYLRTEGLRGELQAGSYALQPHMSVGEIAAIITGTSDVEVESFTVAPERRIDQIRGDLINAGFTPSEVDASLDPERHRDHPALADLPADATLEGYLYPETFAVDASTTADDIVRLSLDQLAERLSDELVAAIEELGLTFHEGVILASVVEREVSAQNDDDRPQVAQVFLSRLAEGMRLESDITALYGAALDGLDPSDHAGYSSPYNTYQNDGLPPGPISNVTLSSLRAVAFPADTDYFYFVSGDDCLEDDGVCTNHFSRTLEEHERLVEQYCQIRCPQP